MQHHRWLSATFTAVALVCVSAPVLADAMSVNFETFTAGALPGGADSRVAGNANIWWVPDNAATYGEVKAGIGIGGSSGLEVGNRGNGNDGVIHNVQSGRLAQAAGESSVAPNDLFTSSFWFRTASEQSVANFAFKTESWGTDRTTWLGFFTSSTGNLQVESSGIDAGGNWVDNMMAAQLSWGQWYRVVTDVVFVNGGAANDTVTYSIYDSGNALLGTLVNNTWEEGQRQFGYNGGQQVAVDAVGFQSRFSPAGAAGAVYIDDVSWASRSSIAAVPEPGSLALVLLAGVGAAAAVRRRRRG